LTTNPYFTGNGDNGYTAKLLSGSIHPVQYSMHPYLLSLAENKRIRHGHALGLNCETSGAPMGQEITTTHFSRQDFEHFQQRLEQETLLLGEWFKTGRLSDGEPVAGFEIEAWLLDEDYHPKPANQAFLQAFNNELASPELAQFNIELNTHPHTLHDKVLSDLHQELHITCKQAEKCAADIGSRILITGILPTLKPSDLTLANMSDMRRYRALNEQVLNSRNGAPLHLEITGPEHLSEDHDNVMLEAATTSFQIHIQVPPETAHHYYNASIIASAPMVAACANSPYLFNKELWDETRIPLFEQSVEVGGYDGAAHGPLRRVSFGSDYARQSILETFEENLEHFPALLPILFDEPESMLSHLRLHNGTIWRWNRPLIGFDAAGAPHIRIEHRVVPAGPSITDSIANAALYYGLTQGLVRSRLDQQLPFSEAKDNFYKAAKSGLRAKVMWPGSAEHISMRKLLLDELLPLAHDGLDELGIDGTDSAHYLGIIRERVESVQNGSEWQRRYCATHGRDMTKLTAAMLHYQYTDRPVHEWDI
jgi:gamma-glutamyl:cysteine ligase YbdK (ATP-grasp superfamily)